MKIKTHWVSLASLTTVSLLLALPLSAVAQTTDDSSGRFFLAQMPALTPLQVQSAAPHDGPPQQARETAKVKVEPGLPLLPTLDPRQGLANRDSPESQQL